MRFLTDPECQQWANVHGYALDAGGWPRPKVNVTATVTAWYPVDLAVLASLAETVRVTAVADSTCLLWMTESWAWPDPRDNPFYVALRQAHREDRPLEETPGHLAHPSEDADVSVILRVALRAGLDMHVLPTARADGSLTWGFVRHDRYVTLFTSRPEGLKEYRAEVGRLGCSVQAAGEV